MFDRSRALLSLEKSVKERRLPRWIRLLRQFYFILSIRILKYRKKSKNTHVPTFWGGKFSGVLPEAVTSFVARFSYFDEPVCRAMLFFVRKDDTVLDIGSHFGFFTLLASRLVESGGRVVAFEAIESTYLQLNKNVKMNAENHNVTAVNIAAGNENSQITFNDFGIVYSSLNSAFGARGPNAAEAESSKRVIHVPMRVLDDWLEENGIEHVSFIKIDTESSEHLVLEGLRKTLDRDHPIISVEVSDMSKDEALHTQNIFSILKVEGYCAYRYIDGSFVPAKLGERIGYDNFLFAIPTDPRIQSAASN